ncbi:MAG: peptide chain release factor N(5)-glutamine methyltransferase [Candidatus Hydrogenedentes bacterium]|nr:peptide chain release factor N(5)-glutamine methyltransferase [Candidatus Hydrogenedentota bacterium]
MATVGQRLDAAVRALADVSESPRDDAEFMLAHVLGVPRSQLHTRFDQQAKLPAFDSFIKRRLKHEPVPYILGEWEFYSLDIEVKAPVLVPRPETEHLVEVVLEHVEGRPARVLEIGTGTGCVAVAIAAYATQAQVVATDINPAALTLASRNAKHHGLTRRMEFRKGDLFAALAPGEAPFDAICSNPPYVESGQLQHLSPSIRKFEDPQALVAGEDGLDVIRRIIAGATQHLVPGGLLALEMGEGHYATVQQLLIDAGFVEPEVRCDLAGIQRIAYAKTPAP